MLQIWEKNIMWSMSQIKRSEETSLEAHRQWAEKHYLSISFTLICIYSFSFHNFEILFPGCTPPSLKVYHSYFTSKIVNPKSLIPKMGWLVASPQKFKFQVHMLNDDTRGATMEAVVSRMKTVESALARSARESLTDYAGIRFMAISATVPNVQDVSLYIIQKEIWKTYSK